MKKISINKGDICPSCIFKVVLLVAVAVLIVAGYIIDKVI